LHDGEVLAINGPSYRLKGRLDQLKRPLADPTTTARTGPTSPTFFDADQPTNFGAA
jgi:hypothetical protein